MTKKLLIIFASGLVLSLTLLSFAWVIGGAEWKKGFADGKEWTIFADDDDEDSPSTKRELTFDANVPLTITTPVSFKFIKGDTVSMTVSGPQKNVNAITWQSGTLSSSRNIHWGNGDVEVIITAPRLPKLIMNGAVDANLEGLDQESLVMETRGAASVEANGKVNSIDVNTAGAGDVDLEKLTANNAKVVTNGAGSATIAATGKVEAEINGVGSISLKRKPSELTSRIHGIGSIDNDY